LLAECARRHGVCIWYKHGVAPDGAATVCGAAVERALGAGVIADDHTNRLGAADTIHGAAGGEPASAQAIDYEGDDRRASAHADAGSVAVVLAWPGARHAAGDLLSALRGADIQRWVYHHCLAGFYLAADSRAALGHILRPTVWAWRRARRGRRGGGPRGFWFARPSPNAGPLLPD